MNRDYKVYDSRKSYTVSWRVVGMVWGAILIYQLDYLVYLFREVL